MSLLIEIIHQKPDQNVKVQNVFHGRQLLFNYHHLMENVSNAWMTQSKGIPMEYI